MTMVLHLIHSELVHDVKTKFVDLCKGYNIALETIFSFTMVRKLNHLKVRHIEMVKSI